MAFGVSVDFNANIGRFTNDLDRLNGRLDQFGANAARIGGLASTAFKTLGVGLSVAGITGLVRATLDEADALDKLNQKTGIAQEKLAGLKLAADLSDTNIDAVAAGVNRLSRVIATNGDELEKLGITAKDPLQAFEQLADVFASIEDPQQRAAVANKILGRSWEELAPLLSGGGQALAEIVERGGRMAGINAELAKSSAEFNDRMTELSASLQGVRNQAIGPLIPILNDLADYFSGADKAAKDFNQSGGALEEIYKTVAEAIAVAGFAAESAGKHLGAFAAQTVALANLDFKGIEGIDKELEADLAKSEKRLDDFFRRVETGKKPEVAIEIKPKISGATEGQSIDLSGGSSAVQNFLKTGDDGQKKLSATFKQLQGDLQRHLRGIEGNIDEEIGLFDFRNRQLEIALDLGLVDQESYFQQKQKLQKDQLAETEALLDQEINALRQFQAQATEDAAKSDAQEKINDLVRKKTDLERDAQIATLKNAAAARQALGDYAAGLADINDLLQGVASNTIGLSQAQAKIDVQQGGTASAEDFRSGKKIFRSADGKSFSDRPAEVGIALDIPREQIELADRKLTDFRDNAAAKIEDAAKNIDAKIADIKPVELGIDVNQDAAVAAAQRARDAAQASVQPVVIPVFYQAQNTPATSAQTPAGADLTQAALAIGGR